MELIEKEKTLKIKEYGDPQSNAGGSAITYSDLVRFEVVRNKDNTLLLLVKLKESELPRHK